MRQPDFNNLLKVLDRGKPDRPTLFEFFLNAPLYEKITGEKLDLEGRARFSEHNVSVLIKAFTQAGYDYATIHGSDFTFPVNEYDRKKSRSLNDAGIIHDWDSFKSYPWPDPDSFDYSRIATAGNMLPDGMKLIVFGPSGVLENVIAIVGYDTLCYLSVDDPKLVKTIFDEVGSRLARYYEICAPYEAVGALISNDDWGFFSQTMLPPEQMRELVFPWHKKFVEIIHKAGKPAILHSCGNLDLVYDDIIDVMKFDGKHSYEDKILPVEEAYDRYADRIAVLGGIDVDFVIRSTPEQVKERSKAMLKRSEAKGSYALGTGNSVPEYVPDDHYFAMTSAALEG